jgi:flavodoxin
MKILIIFHSEHHGNTEKIARAMAKKIDAFALKAEDADSKDIDNYNIIGFGSGIYNGRFHKELSEIISNTSHQIKKKVFIFSTTGSKTYSSMAHKRFKSALEEQGFKVIGEFSCLGFDTALSSEGINKGRPNNQDIAEAEEFIFSIIKNNQ